MLAPPFSTFIRQAWVREGHPEVTFATLVGRWLRHSKKTPEGRRERLAISKRHGLVLKPEAERLRLRPSAVELDDIIDATACLLTAQRLHEHRVIGATDARSLRMEIVA